MDERPGTSQQAEARLNYCRKCGIVLKKLQLRTEELNNKVLLSKEKSGQTTWLLVARSGKVNVLEKLWHRARISQLKPYGLMKEVLMTKDKSGQTAFLMATRSGNVKLLEKLWDWAKELQLKPEKLQNEMWLSKDKFGQTAWHMAAAGGNVKLLVWTKKRADKTRGVKE